MNRLLIRITMLLAGVFLSLPVTAWGWNFHGGDIWKERTGPGVSLAIGGNDCTNKHCSELWDSHLVGSIAATLGFNWRVFPNLSVYLDGHIGYLNTDYNFLEGYADIDDDRGMLVQGIAGAAFHLPVNGWLDLNLGFGLGYAMVRFTGFNRGQDYSVTYKGVDFEFKMGGDFYLFSNVPTLAIGPLFRLGLAVWPSVCIEDQASGVSEDCGKPDSQGRDWGSSFGETPFLIFLGVSTRYGF